MEDLEYAREQKHDLKAAEFDEEYERQMGRLNIEEAEIRYERQPKYTKERAATFILLEKARAAYASLVYLKKCKVVTLKKIDLDIEYLEKKSEDPEETNGTEGGSMSEQK